jgi:predicted DNA-binding protein
MSNTPIRSIRISEELWQATKEAAELDGVTVTSIVVQALEAYIA